MSRRSGRMTPDDVRRACARAGICLARGTEDGLLYFWAENLENIEATMSDQLFGAVIRNQTALLRQVRYMDEGTRDDVAAEQFSNSQQEAE